MKLVHLSDTHLGYRGQGIEKMVADPWRPGVPIRQREADLMLGLMRAADRILEQSRPDVVLHSGNLFDTARPTAHLLDFAMTQLRRLTDAGIPVVIVEGNHSSPRDRSQGHVLRLLAHLPGVQVICYGAERVQVGKILLHAFPHRALFEGILPDRSELDSTCHNVLILHGVANGLPFYKTGRPAVDINIARCATWYEYIALGHYHCFAQVPGTTNAFYAGATAMVTPGDFRPGHIFSFNRVILNGSAASVGREELETRPMHAYGLDDASKLSPAEVLTYLEHQAKSVPPDGAYCRIVVEQLDPLVRRTISTRSVEELFSRAAGLMVSLRAHEQRWDAVRTSLLEGGDVVTRYRQLVAQMDGDAAFHASVEALGTDFLVQAAEKVAEADVAMGGKGEEVGNL